MGDRLSSLRPAGRNLPPSVLETHRYPRTVLLKVGLNSGELSRYLQARARGKTRGQLIQVATFWSERKAGVESSARDPGPRA